MDRMLEMAGGAPGPRGTPPPLPPWGPRDACRRTWGTGGEGRGEEGKIGVGTHRIIRKTSTALFSTKLDIPSKSSNIKYLPDEALTY